MLCRTDLAVESTENIKNNIDGLKVEQYSKNQLKISKVTIFTDNAEKMIAKPKGIYITADIPILTDNIQSFSEKANILSNELVSLLPKEGDILVVGLGNCDITADNLGPKTVNGVLATRHISSELKKSTKLENIRSVAVLAPSVLGKTGIETVEILLAIIKKINPVAVIAVDAFATSDISRLGSTIQISNTGICPGSGVLNSRAEISKNSVGVPVISIGIPTVIDAVSLLSSYSENSGNKEEFSTMIVTPKEIDLLIERASKLLALTINSLLQPDLSCDDIEALLK